MSSLNRRSFLAKTSLGAGASLCLPALSSFAETPKAPWQCVHTTNTMHTTIALSGLAKPITVLQIADTHISCDNDSDRQYEQFSARMNKAFLQPKHYKTDEPTTTVECFKEMMEMAKREQVDLVALVGDIVNYPSATAVEFVRSAVEATGLPHIYTAGNHDWHYEGMKGSSDDLRSEWCEKRLKPLYTSSSLFYSSHIIGGINMVTIDNSTYQVNEEQLAFFRRQLKGAAPVALFVHIPLYMPSMKMCCGNPLWGAAADKNNELERRERWSAQGNLPSTTAFVQEVMAAEKLTGVFAGHWHQYYSMSQGPVNQHLVLPGFNGQYRMIRFQGFA